MALEHAILASLIRQPATGYDLAKEFNEGCFSFFWNATQQQIYRELGKLETVGEVSFTAIPQAGKPDKKLYSITEQGKQKLTEWLYQPSVPSDIRETLAVKLMAGHLIPITATVVEIQRRRQLHEEQLRRIETKVYEMTGAKPGYFDQPEKLPVEDKLFYINARLGMEHELAWLRWCDWALAVLQAED